MQKRMNITVDEDVPAMLEALAGGNKKMGSFLSTLIRGMYQEEGIYRTLETRIAGLEKRVEQIEGDL